MDILSSFWFKVFIINWIMNIIAIEFLVIRKLQTVIKEDEKRDSKYKAFRRDDIKWITRPWLFMTCHLSIIRISIGFMAMFGLSFVSQLVTKGLKEDEPIKGVRYVIMRIASWCTGVTVLFMGSGCIYVHGERPKICYKKYLGTDWEPDYDYKRCGSVVSTHSSFLDIMCHAMTQLPCFIAKQEVKNIPSVGPIAIASQCMFVDRHSAINKKQIQQQTIERQKLCEENPNYDPIVIFSEGGTTNGRYLIKFKKGAFVGLRSIFPKVYKYNSFCQSQCTGVIDGLAHYLMGGCIPFSYVSRIELPIFRPNDFFWKHHQKEGEEKWQTYERTIRTLMSEVGEIPTVEESIEDKFEYKNILYPQKKKNS